MTKRNTEAKWAGILFRAYYASCPFTPEEIARYDIRRHQCIVTVNMPGDRRWGTDSALYAETVIEIRIAAGCQFADTVVIILSMRDVGPMHHIVEPITVITRSGWSSASPPEATVQFMRDRLESWAQDIIHRQVAPRRTARFKEELIAAAWAPARVERWLEAGVELEAL